MPQRMLFHHGVASCARLFSEAQWETVLATYWPARSVNGYNPAGAQAGDFGWQWVHSGGE